jgi:hypothetical protein
MAERHGMEVVAGGVPLGAVKHPLLTVALEAAELAALQVDFPEE